MSSALSVFAQRLNIGHPKPPRPHTNRKASLARRDGVEIHAPGTLVQAFNLPSELQSSEIEDAIPSPPQQFFNHDDASPRIVYSSPSYLSTADLSTPSLSPSTDRSASSLSGTSDGFLLTSSNVSAHVDNSPSSPSPDFAPEDVTLAHRGGIKRLLSLRLSHNRDVAHRPSPPPRSKSPFASPSPPSPRFTLSLLRRSDLDSPNDKCLTDFEDVFDPFSRESPSVFYNDGGKPSHEPIVNSWLSLPEAFSETDDPEVQARSPLNDLSVYLCRPPQPHANTSSRAKSRLHIWVSGIEPHDQSPTIGINLAAQPRVPPRRPKCKSRKPKLRPLVLPNLAALREIVNAQQQASIAPPTCPPRTVVPQQQRDDAPCRGSHHTASPESASAGLVYGRLVASPLPPPELVTSTTEAFAVALGSGHARTLSREFISGPVIVRRSGDGNVGAGAAPQQRDAEVHVPSQPQCHCSAPVLHRCECVRPSQDRGSEAEESPRLKHWHEGETLRRLDGRNCDKPLPEEPQDQDKPLPRDPLNKPLPQLPSGDRLDGLIALLYQAGVIDDMESAQSLHALALACGPGHAARASVNSPKMQMLQLRSSSSMDLRRAVLEAMNDKAGPDPFAKRSSSLWGIATQWAYAL